MTRELITSFEVIRASDEKSMWDDLPLIAAGNYNSGDRAKAAVIALSQTIEKETIWDDTMVMCYEFRIEARLMTLDHALMMEKDQASPVHSS